MVLMSLEADETQLHHVAQRLLAQFGAAVGPDVVMSTVHSIAALWSAAPVQEFVPLLVERRSRSRLRVLSAQHETPNGAPDARS